MKQHMNGQGGMNPQAALTMVLTQFLLSVVILAGVVVSDMIAPTLSADAQAWAGLLTVFGIAAPFLGIFLKRKLLAPPGTTMGPRGGGTLPQPSKVFVAHIIAFALFEVAAIVGFILFMLTGERDTAYILFAISIAFMALHWPRKTAS